MKTDKNFRRKQDKKGVGRFEKIKELGQRKEGSNEYVSNDLNRDGSNNPAWHCVNDTVGENAGRVSFAQPMGYAITTTSGAFPGVGAGSRISRIAGIMVNRYVPTFGPAIKPDDAMNVAAKEMFNEVRKMNSSTPPYDRNNLMMVQIGISEAFSLICEAVRAVAMRNLYGIENRFVGESLITALGYDYDDLTVNKADWVSAINLAILKIQSLPIPNTMAYSLRQMWLNSNVFIDENISKSQIYCFVRDGYYKYEGYKAKNGSVLSFFPREKTSEGSCLWTKDAWVKYFNDLTTNLFEDEDVAKISSEILKRFEGSLLSLNQITEEYTILPVHDVDALLQIHNSVAITDQFPDTWIESIEFSGNNCSYADMFFPKYSPETTIIGGLYGIEGEKLITYPAIHDDFMGFDVYSSLDVVEDGRFCKQLVCCSEDADIGLTPVYFFGDKIIDTYEDKPSWQRVLEMTRFIPTAKKGTIGIQHDGNTTTRFDSVVLQGLDLITARFIVTDQITKYDMNSFFTNTPVNLPSEKIHYLIGRFSPDDEYVSFALTGCAYAMQFNYSPMVYMLPTANSEVVFSDLNNYTIIPKKNIELLNQCDALALLVYRTGLPK